MRLLLMAAILSYAGVQGLQSWQPETFGSTQEVLEAAVPLASPAPDADLVVLVGERDVLSSVVPIRVENRGRKTVRNAEVTCASTYWFMERTLFNELVPRIAGPGNVRLGMPAADTTTRMACRARRVLA